ncbi:MAG: hypothetical protein ACRCYX_10550 [Dermatophilaceae bacterium]
MSTPESTADELAVIEAEWPVVAAELEVVAAWCCPAMAVAGTVPTPSRERRPGEAGSSAGLRTIPGRAAA